MHAGAAPACIPALQRLTRHHSAHEPAADAGATSAKRLIATAIKATRIIVALRENVGSPPTPLLAQSFCDDCNIAGATPDSDADCS